MFGKKLIPQKVNAVPKQQLTKVRHVQRLYLLWGLLFWHGNDFSKPAEKAPAATPWGKD